MAKPMYNKYFEVWSTHSATYGPKTALLYQVGGFFEIYDVENLTTGQSRCNIREIAEVCQLSLATHEIGPSEQSLFGGFPEHALHKFERTLVTAGYTVVVVVQKKKNGSVEERIVDHISSPGCYVEAKERYLVGCILESITGGPAALHKVYWAATAFDSASGSITIVEGGDRDRLHQFICAYPPSELIVWSDGLVAANKITESMKSICDTVHIRCLGPASVALDETILELYWPKQVYRMTTRNQPQARRSLAATMEFARDHMLNLKGLALPTVWLPTDEVRLGNAALEQLGVISLTRKSQSLLGLLDTCRSVAGKRLLRARLMRPVSDLVELRKRIKSFEAPLSPETDRHLRSLYDTSRIFRRIELGTATIQDIGCLMRTYEASLQLIVDPVMKAHLKKVLAPWSIPILVDLGKEGSNSGIPTSKVPCELIDAESEVFKEGQVILKEAEGLATSLGVSLDTHDGGFRLVGTKRKLQSAHATLRDGGDLTATIAPFRSGFILETSEMTRISGNYAAWFARWSPLWLQKWSTILEDLAKTRDIHQQIEGRCAEIDVIWSVSATAKAWGWTLPEYVEDIEGFVDAVQIRHPILEQIHNQVPYVAQDVKLSTESKVGLLLYGMNASGKSSLMKAVGLSTLLAQCGFPVPATKFRLAPFTAIFTRILGNDNIWAGLSSFAVEMTEFREVLQYADQKALVLGDELCSGTESMSATALVAAGIETLAARKTKFVFATHLHELGSMKIPGVFVAHLAVHYDEATDTLVYDRTLKSGSGSALYGLEVCKALDMPADFLARALTIRKGLENINTPHTSPYSKDVVVASCQVCQSTTGLETHHIQHQATYSGPPAGLNSPDNLVPLCSACHDDLHAGRLDIVGWQETSDGRRLLWSRSAKDTLDPEVADFIRLEKGLKRRTATIQRVALQRFGVQLTAAQIKAC